MKLSLARLFMFSFGASCAFDSLLLFNGFEGSSVGVEAHFLAVVPVPLADLVVGHADFLSASQLVCEGPNRACLEGFHHD